MGRRPRKPATNELPTTKAISPVGDGTQLAAQSNGTGDVSDVYAGPNAESAHRSLDGSEQLQRRDFAGLDKALECITPTVPLTYDDAAAIFDVVRQFAPAPLIRDVMHDHREIVVRIYDGKTQIYEHRLKAHKAKK